jgi:hypothetical protein
MNEPRHQPVDRLPKHTTPTWEVELLISGVAVFAMLQLPGWLDDKLWFLLPRFDERWHSPLDILFAYFTSAAVILAATFATHLLLRAYWIALVGMHSVYPDGIRWERLRLGPVKREVMQSRGGDRARAVDRADNRASILFATGVVLASILVIFSGVVIGLFALGLLIARFAGIQVGPDTVFLACVLVVSVPMLALNVLDRLLGARLSAGDRSRRALAAGFALYSRAGLGNWGGVLGLLASHHGRRRIQMLIVIVIAACVGGVLVNQKIDRAPDRFGNYAWFPHFDLDSRNLVSAGYYDDQRDPLRSPMTAFIQSAEIDGSYARLVVPYEPDRDAAAMLRDCPTVATIADNDSRAAAMLSCLASLHPVMLDGKPLDGLRYDAGSDARTDRPALVAMIDVRALAAGRHELAITRPPSLSDDGKLEPSSPWIIPFWH